MVMIILYARQQRKHRCMDMANFTLWMLDILNFYKLFLALFANTFNLFETIVFFEGLLSRFFGWYNTSLDQIYYSPLVRQYCLQGHTDVMGIMSNFHAGGGDTIRLGAIWDSRIVPYNPDQYYQLSAENWKGITCILSQFSVCSSLLWTLSRVSNLFSWGDRLSLPR